MTANVATTEQTTLRNWINVVYGLFGGEPLPRERFPQDSWRAIADLVHYNKGNPLVAEAVRRHPDLIPRCFTILTVLYGAYTSEPSRVSILKDLVSMLGKDLVEEERRVLEYAQTKGSGSFFPELYKVQEKIREIYATPRFNRAVLPPTPYHAYALHVLNSYDMLGKNTTTDLIFGQLFAHHSRMESIVQLARRPDLEEGVEPNNGPTFH
ncbi:MAG TPA: hypothetical protein VJJ02_01985 [Candidatus Paceibacterota bacterium]|nr:MAG: hypothetical protein A3H76_05530 [Candidatus Lloydbacteria bacterium RIFCSPLOWO2_02_FULL_54_12]